MRIKKGDTIMAKMSRDSFSKGSGLFGLQPKEVEAPEKSCGVCKHYLESTFSSDGRGTCGVLKDGSDITSDPPVFNLEAKNGYMLKILTDASRCTYYEKMDFIDHDGTECSDPKYRRSMRQLQDK